MRRMISILLAFALLFSWAPVFAADTEPVSIRVSPYDTDIAAQTTTVNADTYAAFEALFAAAKKETRIRDIAISPIADVVLGENTRYTVWKTADGELYRDEGRYIIDAAQFYALLDSLGYGFYKLRPVPAVTVGEKPLAINASTYSFLKLDGKFWRSRYSTLTAPVVTATSGQIPTPAFAMQAKSVTAELLAEGEASPLFRGKLADMPVRITQKGIYELRYTVTYENPLAKGQVVYVCRLSYGEAPVSVINDSTTPGELVILRATDVPQGAKVTAATDVNFTPQFFEESPGTWIALLPVSCYVQPGRHPVTISVGGETSRFEVTVQDKEFVRQDLTVPAATAQETINSRKANDEYEQNIAPLRKMADATRYWSGRFVWPVKAQWRRTTQFGMQRYTNGSPTASIHAALDMAAPTGTPTYATGAGRVLYAGNLQLTGGTIVIEHGYGLKSWYYHLNSVDVKAGDIVRQDQQIGTVGSTGFSTGPHLHFGMSVGSPHSRQFFINPETLITTDLVA